MPSIGNIDTMARQTKAPQQIAAVSVFLPLAITAVVVRIWIRNRMINSLGWDDAMMVVALVRQLLITLRWTHCLPSHQINFMMYDVSLMVIVGNGGGTHLRNINQMRVAINVRRDLSTPCSF
jgi:hypothetical protein